MTSDLAGNPTQPDYQSSLREEHQDNFRDAKNKRVILQFQRSEVCGVFPWLNQGASVAVCLLRALGKGVSLSFPASGSCPHSLAHELFLRLPSQQHSIFQPLSCKDLGGHPGPAQIIHEHLPISREFNHGCKVPFDM